MKYTELGECYTLSESTVEELRSAEVFDETLSPGYPSPSPDTYEQSLKRIMSLRHAGMELKRIKVFMQLEHTGESTLQERVNMLRSQRQQQLELLHENQRNIDRLDYLIHDLKVHSTKGE